jgi:hypothetical protein
MYSATTFIIQNLLLVSCFIHEENYGKVMFNCDDLTWDLISCPVRLYVTPILG